MAQVPILGNIIGSYNGETSHYDTETGEATLMFLDQPDDAMSPSTRLIKITAPATIEDL